MVGRILILPYPTVSPQRSRNPLLQLDFMALQDIR